MRKHGVHQLFLGGLKVHRDHIALDQFGDLGADHMRAQQLAGLPIEDYFDQSLILTEQAAKEQKLDIRVGRFPFVGNGKAIALGEDQGLVKVIFDKKTGQLLGAHMVGAEVTELIQGYVIAMNLETTEEELMHTVFPHPTLSEMMKEAVLDAYGRVLNI